MNIRDTLIYQAPSLAAWREAQAEIARLDSAVRCRDAGLEACDRNDAELRRELTALRVSVARVGQVAGVYDDAPYEVLCERAATQPRGWNALCTRIVDAVQAARVATE